MGVGGKLQGMGPFNRGVNNRRPEFDLRTKEGDFIRSGVNVDISATGAIKRRAGYELVVGGTDCHSIFAVGEEAYFVDGSDLKKVTGLDSTPTVIVLKSDMAAGRHVSFTKAFDSIYFTNGVVTGRIDASGAHPLGCPPLQVEPVVAGGVESGSLQNGLYQLCFAYINADGEQSGTTAVQAAQVAAGSIAVADLPTSFPDTVTGLMVFMSPLNSDQLMHVMTLAAPQSSLTIAAQPAYGARCQTLMLASMPAGAIVRMHNGRLLTASKKTLTYSEPYLYALTNPERNYIAFNADITVVEPTDNGVYVVADRAYWLVGNDVASAELKDVLPYGAVLGTSGAEPDSSEVWWMSTRGLVIADENGQVKNVQEDNVAVDPAPAGASLFREQDGLKQIVTTTFNPGTSVAATRSYMDGEIIRKGVVL